jgi:ABC-type enterobactin transport system permease subunit
MSLPTACIRCKGTELVPVAFEVPAAPRVVVDSDHTSLVTARVCLACGAVLLTASDPFALRVNQEPDRGVQEYDF